MTIGVIINNSNKLMSHERNIEFLNRLRIIYKRDPITDKPSHETEHYRFYEDGTYQCYQLFKSKAKINTYKSLKWHILVIWYLNPHLSKSQLRKIAIHLSTESNGFTTFVIKEGKLDQILESLYTVDIDTPPKNRIRKIIFKDNCVLDRIEKLKLVGKILGKSKQADESDIYEAMLFIHEEGKKITISAIAKYLKVSTRTIFRNINSELNQEKDKLNNETLQHSKLRSIKERVKSSSN